MYCLKCRSNCLLCFIFFRNCAKWVKFHRMGSLWNASPTNKSYSKLKYVYYMNNVCKTCFKQRLCMLLIVLRYKQWRCNLGWICMSTVAREPRQLETCPVAESFKVGLHSCHHQWSLGFEPDLLFADTLNH